jgi:endonuclease YncB( thermonuclease family)
MAWWYRAYANVQPPKDREDYEVAEINAKMRRTGLWADKNPVPPWEWRREER